MTETPREDIIITPTYAILEFGDGYIALIQGAVENEDKDGLKQIVFTIKPSQLLRKRYNIPDSALNRNGCLDIPCYRKDLIPINIFDDANRKWFYIKNFLHQETEVAKFTWDLRQRLSESERRIILLEGELIWYSEQLRLAKTGAAEFLTQGTEVIDKIFSTKMMDALGKRSSKDELSYAG